MSIQKPGRYPGVPMRVYHEEWDALSSSDCKALLKSAKHYKLRKEEEREATEAQANGVILHSLLLAQDIEPGLVVKPKGMDLRRKADKERYAELMAEAPDGAYVVKEEAFAVLSKVAGEVKSTAVWKALVGNLEDCDIETSHVYEDGQGVLCKFRPDALNGNGIMLDLKSTGVEPWPEAFERQSYNMGYHISAAHYMAGARALDMEVSDFVLIVFEQKYPNPAVAAYRMSEDLLALGYECRAAAIERYQRAVETGLWPGLNETVVDGVIAPQLLDLGAPRWARLPDGTFFRGSEVWA